jgi:bifunctional DNA-binding transcriptional regulator/antitoxin component of YhaV-PrlF toxin-antitoxin module
MERFHGFVHVQGRGTVVLPAALRRRYHLDEPGAQVEITERPDGVLEVRPAVAVPASQAWFWTEERQLREREVDAHVAAGEVTTFNDIDDFLQHLDALDEQESSPPAAPASRRRGGRTRQ